MNSIENKDTNIRQRVMVGTASNYVGQVINFATLFFLTPFILHQLGPVAYGLWVLIGSIVAYGSLLDFGIWGTIIKYVAEFRARGENEQARALVATALRLYMLLGLLVFLLSVILAPYFGNLFKIPPDQQSTATILVMLMGLGIGVSLPGMIHMSMLRGLQRYDIVNLIEVTVLLTTALATVFILITGGGVIGLVLVNISGIFLMLAMSTWFVHRAFPELKVSWRDANRNMVRTVVTYSWPLFVKDGANRLQTKTDEITIGAFLPVNVIAPYSLARRLSEITQTLTRQFMKVILPLASELHADNDMTRLRQVYTASTRLTLAISLAIACPLILLARPVLTLWVGPNYASAGNLVVILTLASLLATCQWPAGAVLQGMARHRLLAATALISGVVNLGLSIALVRPYGLTGIAFGTLIPTAIEFAIILPLALRIIGVSATLAIREIFLPALIPAILMVLVLQIMQRVIDPYSLVTLLVIAGAGLVVYAICYLSIGASNIERQTYRGIAFNIFQLARTRLRRLG